MKTLRVGTRCSPLALWQARYWVDCFQRFTPNIQCTLVPISTVGDRTSGSLCAVGGKGLFSKDIHEAMLRGDIDCAVHSLKDVEVIPHAPTPWQSSFIDLNICIAAVIPAGPTVDVLVTHHGKECHTIATGSHRRQAQISQMMSSSIKFVNARGNVATRLNLIGQEINGTLLSLAGLQRLGLWKSGETLESPFDHLHVKFLPDLIPAAGQGVLAVDAIDPDVLKIISITNDKTCSQHRFIERRVLQILQANCYTAIGLESIANGVRWYYQGHFGWHACRVDNSTTAHSLALHLQSLVPVYSRVETKN